jgi:glycosyltransferase involved in cell wall biosynthesis
VVLGPEPQQAARDSGDPLDVVFVGRLTNWKGVETALLALRDLHDVRLTVIGSGPEAPLLEALTQQMRLNEVVSFLGRLSREATETRVRRAHVLLLPSCYEGLSHTLLEAGERGVAIVASDVGGNRALVDSGRNGLLVPYADPAALADALRRIRDDEGLRLHLVGQMRQDVERHSFAGTTDSYVALLGSPEPQ